MYQVKQNFKQSETTGGGGGTNHCISEGNAAHCHVANRNNYNRHHVSLTLDGNEVRLALVGDGLGHQRLSAARGAVEENTPGGRHAELFELLRVFHGVLHQLLQLALDALREKKTPRTKWQHRDRTLGYLFIKKKKMPSGKKCEVAKLSNFDTLKKEKEIPKQNEEKR